MNVEEGVNKNEVDNDEDYLDDDDVDRNNEGNENDNGD